MKWPVGHVYVRAGDELVPSDQWHLVDPARTAPFCDATRATRFHRGVGLIGRVLEAGDARWMLDVDRSTAFLRMDAAARAGLASGFAFPVLAGSDVAAVLEFYTQTREPPDEQTLSLMVHVGTQLGRVVERERHAAAVRALSLRDELTGLLNRRGFLELGRHHYQVAARTGRPFALMFADLNGMKAINDRLGHEVGDAALRDTADILRSVFRQADLLARLGGDEFVILAVDVDPLRLAALTDRVQDGVRAFNDEAKRVYCISISLGVTVFDPGVPKPLETMLADADAEMYAQKRARRAARTLSIAVAAM